MKFSLKTARCLGLCLSLFSLLQTEVQALTYNIDSLYGMLCFRKLNAPNPFDLEVNIGPITNYSALPVGTHNQPFA